MVITRNTKHSGRRERVCKYTIIFKFKETVKYDKQFEFQFTPYVSQIRCSEVDEIERCQLFV